MIKRLVIIIFLLLTVTSISYADTIANNVSCLMGSDPLLNADGADATFNCVRVANSNEGLTGCGNTDQTQCRFSIRSASCSNVTTCAKIEVMTVKAVSFSTDTYTFTVRARDLENTHRSSGDWVTGDKVEMINTSGQEVISVGDCASGACADGTSDGGTYLKISDGVDNYVQLQTSVSSTSDGSLSIISTAEDMYIKPTSGVTTETGQGLFFTGGNGGATSGAGGNVHFGGGAALGGNSNGGNVVFAPGSKAGSGTYGSFLFYNPTVSYYMKLDTANIASSDKTFTAQNKDCTLMCTEDTTFGGNAATATALAANGANCSAGEIALGVDASGVAECTATPSGLTSVGATTFTGALTGNATSATDLADGDQGDFTCTTGTCTVDNSAIQYDDIDFLVDEDNMVSNSAVKVPTQQSVKAYVDNEVSPTGIRLSNYNPVCDGTTNPLSDRYGTVGEAQAAYPNAGITGLTQEIDWAAMKQSIYDAETVGLNWINDGGDCVIKEGLTFSTSATYMGMGTNTTIIRLWANGTTITVPSTADGITIKDMQIYGSAATHTVLGIHAGDSIGWLHGMAIENVSFNGIHDMIELESTVSPKIDRITSQDVRDDGIKIWDSYTPTKDNFDGTISNSRLQGSTSCDKMIYQLSGGGTRLQNNKFIDCDYIYYLEPEAGTASGLLIINSNSFEFGETADIYINAGAGSWEYFTITGNQFSNFVFAWATSTAYYVGDKVSNSTHRYRCLEAHTSGTFATDLAAGKWVLEETAEAIHIETNNGVISDNIFASDTAGTTTAMTLSGTGIAVGMNSIRLYDTGINVTSGSNITVVPQEFDLVTTQYTDPLGIIQFTGPTGGDVEAGDSTLVLRADQGDDAADDWFLTSQASDNHLLVKNSTSTIVDLTNAGVMTLKNPLNAGDSKIALVADKADDTPDTWNIVNQASTNYLQFLNGTTEVMRLYPDPGALYVPIGITSGYTFAPYMYGNNTADGTLTIQASSHADPTTDAIIFVTNQTEQARINNAGDWSINGNVQMDDSKELYLGTGSDLELFHDGSNSYIQNNTGGIVIENDTSDGDISFKVNDGGADTTVMTIDGATSRVGIGTTSPQTTLHFSATSATAAAMFQSNSDTVTHTGQLSLRKNNSATETLTTTESTDVLGTIAFQGVNAAGTPVAANGAQIKSVQDGAAGATYLPAYLSFLTGTDSATVTERLRIASDGGIFMYDLKAKAAGNYFLCMEDDGTEEVTLGDATNCTVSTIRAKYDVNYNLLDNALDIVLALKPAYFKFKDDGSEHIGFIAEDMPSYMQTLDRDGLIGNFDDRALLATLVNAIKELKSEIDELKQKCGN